MVSNEDFPGLVQQYKDMIFRLAYSYTKNHFDADDVTQNVLLLLYKTDRSFETDAHIKNRVTLLLYYYEGYSIREITGIMGVPEKTVSPRLARGKRILKELLPKEVAL